MLSLTRAMTIGTLITGFTVACSAKQEIDPHKTSPPTAAGAVTLQDLPVKKLVVSNREAPSGIYIPVPEGRNLVFRFVSLEPITLAAGEVLDDKGQPAAEVPALKTVGPVRLGSGLEVGGECSEHLRIGDTIVHGAFQNAGTRSVQIELASGTKVILKPRQAVYVGNDCYVVEVIHQISPKAGRVALQSGPDKPQPPTHTIQCVCTCDCGAGVTSEVRIPGGSVCVPAGNQCGMDGMDCRIDEDGSHCEGTLTDCHEELVPIQDG